MAQAVFLPAGTAGMAAIEIPLMTMVDAPRAITRTPGHAAPAGVSLFCKTADMAPFFLVSLLNYLELSLSGCICKPVLVLSCNQSSVCSILQ